MKNYIKKRMFVTIKKPDDHISSIFVIVDLEVTESDNLEQLAIDMAIKQLTFGVTDVTGM